MFNSVQKSFYGLALALLVNCGFAADGQNDDQEKQKYPFSVKFVDEDGKPVEGAKAGINAYYEKPRTEPPRFRGPDWFVDDNGWKYHQVSTTNAEGIANFPAERKEHDHLCIVARQAERKLVGIWKIEPDKLAPEKTPQPVKIIMQPECRVFGGFACSDLAKRGREIGWTNVYLNSRDGRAFSCVTFGDEFHFFVPPGEYELDLYGEKLHHVDQHVSIQPGQRELDLGPIEVPATEWALLLGEPAPELEGIASWKNSTTGVKLSDINGKCVILDFWGHWCGPCIHGMPELFKVYDRYHDQGLEIIGIHVDQGEEEERLVDTVEELDRRLTQTREKIWQGRDIPYPVGLVVGKLTAYGASNASRKARSPLSAVYGITGYPTLILIDRKGTIVKDFDPEWADDIKLLEKLLNEK